MPVSSSNPTLGSPAVAPGPLAISSRVVIGGTTSASSPTGVTGGIELQVYHWSVTLPSYGAVGSFEIETSLEYLRQANIDIYNLSLQTISPIPVQIFVTDQYGNNDYLVFGGEYDKSDWDFRSDTVTLHGRDWAGILVDSKITMQDQLAFLNTAAANQAASSFSATGTAKWQINQMTIPQFVTQAAANYGFTKALDTSQLTVDNLGHYPMLGTLIGDTQTYATAGKPVWELLVFCSRLASQTTPYAVYITPGRVLYFGPMQTSASQVASLLPSTLSGPLQFSWNLPSEQLIQTTPTQANKNSLTEYPLMDLNITHNARRNSTFGVVVLSYNYATITSHQAVLLYVNDANFTANQAAWNTFGVSSPGFKKGVNPYGGSNLMGALGRPIYVFRARQAMDYNQAQAEAYKRALEIAKNEIIVEGTIDGIANLVPQTQFTLDGSGMDLLWLNIDGSGPRTFYINKVEHEFTVPQGGTGAAEGVGSGFTTKITGWTFPITSTVLGEEES